VGSVALPGAGPSHPAPAPGGCPLTRGVPALRSGPPGIRDGAKVVDMEPPDGTMTVLREGTNGWTCMPGVETASADMCADEMGMQWFMDITSRHEPTNTAPCLIYMLNGAVQQSYRPVRPHQSAHSVWPTLDADALGTRPIHDGDTHRGGRTILLGPSGKAPTARGTAV